MKRWIALLVAILFFFKGPMFYIAQAQTTGYIGAKAVGPFPIACTCPAGVTGSLGAPPPPGFLWMVFAKIYLKPANPGVVPSWGMVYPPEIMFTGYSIAPGSNVLGKYYPSPYAKGCGIYVDLGYYRFCIPLLNLGSIVPFTGASAPSGS